MDDLTIKEKAIIDIIKNENDYDVAYYFFRDATKPKWFNILKSDKIFSVSRIPTPEYKKNGNWSVKQWIVLPYMIRLAKQVSESPNEYAQLGRDLVLWMQSICTSMSQEQKKNYTVGNTFLRMVTLLPEEYINTELIENIFMLVRPIPIPVRDHYEIIMKLLPKLLEFSDQIFFYQVLEIVINDLISVKEKESDAIYWFDEFIEKYENDLIKCNPQLIVELFNKRIENAIDKEKERDTHLSLYQENSTLYYSDTIIDRFIFYLNRLLIGFYIEHKEYILTVITNYLKSPYVAFYKLGWFSLAQVPEHDLNNVFFEKIITDKDIAGKAFASLYAQDELKKALEKILPLKETQVQEMFDFIQLGSKSVSKETRNIWLQKRYSLFLSNNFFADKYNNLKEITGIDCTLEPYLSIESRCVSYSSPLQESKILNMPIEELVNWLKTFQGKSFFGDSPSVNGLAEVMRNVMKKHATIFPKEWDLFLDVWYVYTYSMLNGLRECEDKKNVPWDKICSFLLKYMQRKEFVEGKLKITDDEWGIGVMEFSHMVLLTLRDIPRDCSNAQDLVIYICKLSETFNEESRSAFDLVFNTLRGSSFYNLLLLEKSSQYHLAQNPIFDILGQSILKQDKIAHTVFGYFYREFLSLNVSWTNRQRDFIKSNDEKCRIWMMEGYFSSNYITKNIAKDMDNFYEFAIGKKFRGVSVSRVTQHITCMYLYNFFGTEKSNDIFYKYLRETEQNGNSIWNDILNYIRRQDSSSVTQEIFKEKILPLWNYMNNATSISPNALWQATELIQFSYQPIGEEQYNWIKKAIELQHTLTGLYQFLNTVEKVWKIGSKFNKTKDTSAYISDWLYTLVKNFENIYFFEENRWYQLITELVKNGDDTTKRKLKDFNDICMKRGYDIFAEIFKS